MPSGVSQGALSAGAGPGLSAKAILVKSGIRLICSVKVSAVRLLKNIVSRVQCRQGVATFGNERLDARLSQRILLCRGMSSPKNMASPASFERRGCRGQFRFGSLSGRAQASDWRLRGLVIARRSAKRLNAAGFEKVLGEICARGEFRRCAQSREENPRPRAGRRKKLIGAIAQGFERFGEPQ